MRCAFMLLDPFENISPDLNIYKMILFKARPFLQDQVD